MTQQLVNVGAAPDDKTGDPLRSAFIKINTNFTEVYTRIPVPPTSDTGGGSIGIGDGALSGQTIPNTYNNTAYGTRAMSSSMGIAAVDNTAIGYQALQSDTQGAENTAVGMNALRANNTGIWNSGFGSGALANNSSGQLNTAVGGDALNGNTLGGNNCAMGFGALIANTTGSGNIGIGFEVLFKNTTGGNNIGIGPCMSQMLTGNGNIAIGQQALDTLTDNGSLAGAHIAIGNQSMQRYNDQNPTNAIRNTAVGGSTFQALKTGGNNTAFGFEAGLFCGRNDGSQRVDGSTAIGALALCYNTDGSFNTAVGYFAMFGQGRADSPTFGSNNSIQNTAIGAQALRFAGNSAGNVVLGYNALSDLVDTGVTPTWLGQNTVIGWNSGRGIVSGQFNTILGANVIGLAAGLSNNVIIADGQGNIRAQCSNTGGWKFGALYAANGAARFDATGNLTSVPDVIGAVAGNAINQFSFVSVTKADGAKHTYRALSTFTFGDLVAHEYAASPTLLVVNKDAARFGAVVVPTNFPVAPFACYYTGYDGRIQTALDSDAAYRTKYSVAAAPANTFYVDKGSLLASDTLNDGRSWNRPFATYGAARNAVAAVGSGYRFATSTAAWAAGVVTLTTTAAHNLVPGNPVSFVSINPAGYNGTYICQAGTTGSTIVVNLPTNPGAYVSGGNIYNLTGVGTIYIRGLNGGAAYDRNSGLAFNSGTPLLNMNTIGVPAPDGSPVYCNNGWAINEAFFSPDSASPSTDVVITNIAIGAGSQVTTATPHGFVALDRVLLYGIAGVTIPITAAAWAATSGGQATFTTGAVVHNIIPGQMFNISGVTPIAYNGTYVALAGTTASTLIGALPATASPGAGSAFGVLSLNNCVYSVSSPTSLTFSLQNCNTTNFSAYGSGGQVSRNVVYSSPTNIMTAPGRVADLQVPRIVIDEAGSPQRVPMEYDPAAYTVIAATFSGGIITLTMATPHTIKVGQPFVLSGANNAAWNGSYVAAGPGTTGSTLTAALASNPGAASTPFGAVSFFGSTPLASLFAKQGNYWWDSVNAKFYVNMIGGGQPTLNTDLVIGRSNTEIGLAGTRVQSYIENVRLLFGANNSGIMAKSYNNNVMSLYAVGNGFAWDGVTDSGARNSLCLDSSQDGFNHHNIGPNMTAATLANPVVFTTSATNGFVTGDYAIVGASSFGNVLGTGHWPLIDGNIPIGITGITKANPAVVGAGASSAVTMSIGAGALVTWANHNLPVGTVVMFSGAVPTGVTVGLPYYVIAAGYTANAFQFSATLNGAAVTTSGSAGAITATTQLVRVGDFVLLQGIAGMTQLNGNIYPVTAATPTGYTITVDTTGFGTYTGGGLAYKVWPITVMDPTHFSIPVDTTAFTGTFTSGSKFRPPSSTYHELNCTALNSGQYTGSNQSCTSHENCQGFCVNGLYKSGYRNGVCDISLSRRWMVGSRVEGTQITGSDASNQKVLFFMTDASCLALDRVKWGGYGDATVPMQGNALSPIRVLNTEVPPNGNYSNVTAIW